MPLFYENTIYENTRLGIWKIEEKENFFYQKVSHLSPIHHPHKRLQHLAGRYLLRTLFPDFPEHEIKIINRKPYLPHEQYYFSISHCGNYAAAIVSSIYRVGIDIEIPQEKIEHIAPKFLSVQEQTTLQPFLQPNKIQYLTLLWAAKEAAYKWNNHLVNFKQQIKIQSFEIKRKGNIAAFIHQNTLPESIVLHYALFPQLCLVWIYS
jgi:4'-phosphopantetheinyl transferase EntD